MYWLRRARRFLFSPWIIRGEGHTMLITFRTWHPAYWAFMAGCLLRALRDVRVEVGQ